MANLGAFANHIRFAGCGVSAQDMFWAKVNKQGPNGCWIWTGSRNQWDYGLLRIRGKALQAHRQSYEWAHGPIPKGLLVLHRCDNPPCCNPAHLWLGTDKDNCADKMAKGRGNNKTRAKLNEDQVRAIRSLYRKTGPRKGNAREVAARFGVTPSMVHSIGRGDSWKDVK
jgi:hypothetical protein